MRDSKAGELLTHTTYAHSLSNQAESVVGADQMALGNALDGGAPSSIEHADSSVG